MTLSKKGDYTDFMVPTATRQPESLGALAAKDELVRKRYQKLEDYYHKVTNLTNWCAELTLSVHITGVREEADLMISIKLVILLTKISILLIVLYQIWIHIHTV